MFTLEEQRWVDECISQLHLDIDTNALGILAAQKAILFLAKHTEWFNYVVSKSRWCTSYKAAPVMADDYIDCEAVPEIREEMANLANRPRNVVRVQPPFVAEELHHTTCAWFEVTIFESLGRRAYFALRDQFDRGDFETDEVEFRDFLVKESLVSQTTVWELSDANAMFEKMIASPKCDRVNPPQSEGSRALSCLIIDVIRKADQVIPTAKFIDALIGHLETALRAGQRFDDLDLLGVKIAVGAKELTSSALHTRIAGLKKGLTLI